MASNFADPVTAVADARIEDLPVPADGPEGLAGGTAGRHLGLGKLLHYSGLLRFSGLYALVIAVGVFGWLDSPATFYTTATLRFILASAAISGLLSLGAVVPFTAGMLDLQFAYIAGLAMVVLAWMSDNVHLNDVLLVLISLAACLGVGVISGLLVARLRLSSLIITLGIGTVVLGICYLVVGTQSTPATLAPWLTEIGRGDVGPFPVPVLIFGGLVILMDIWLERSASGRVTMLVGRNPLAAQLTGINVRRVQLGSLMFAAVLAGAAGIVACAQTGFADSTQGSALLFPAVSAVLLGSTQVRFRVNVLGTAIAVLVIQTAVYGLDLHVGGSAAWPSNIFSGLFLLIAVSAAAIGARRRTVSG